MIFLKKTFEAEPVAFWVPVDTDEIRTIRLIPRGKFDSKLPYNLKIKIYACISNLKLKRSQNDISLD